MSSRTYVNDDYSGLEVVKDGKEHDFYYGYEYLDIINQPKAEEDEEDVYGFVYRIDNAIVAHWPHPCKDPAFEELTKCIGMLFERGIVGVLATPSASDGPKAESSQADTSKVVTP